MSIEKVAMNDELLDKVSGGSVLPYVVQAGDTLGVIAKKFNVTVEQLMKWNNLKDPNFLTVGQRLVIYGSAGVEFAFGTALSERIHQRHFHFARSGPRQCAHLLRRHAAGCQQKCHGGNHHFFHVCRLFDR